MGGSYRSSHRHNAVYWIEIPNGNHGTAQDTTIYAAIAVMNLLVLVVHHLSMVYSSADDVR